MFEELGRTHPVRLANSKRSKLHYLLAYDVNYKIIDEIEARAGHKFSSAERQRLLRRIQEEYKKRPLQHETYEQWHEFKILTANKAVLEQNKSKRRKKDTSFSVPLEDFDEHLKNTILEELSTTGPDDGGSSPENRVVDQLLTLPESRSAPDFNSDSDSDSDSNSNSNSDSDSDSDTESTSDASHQRDVFSEVFEWDDEIHPDSKYALQKLSQWKTSFDTLRTWTRDKYQLKVWGLENMGDSADHVSASIMKQHLHSLTALLHVNILRRNWGLAYKIVCLVVRFDVVDIRALWPLALEVLFRKKEEMRAAGSVLKRELIKEEQFCEWLTSSFPISHTSIHSAYNFLGPVYRSATRTYAPVYVITFLWELLVQQSYSKLRDMAEDLILQPPYSTDGVFHFILALTNIGECVHLASFYINFDRNVGSISDNEDIGDLAEDMMLMGSKETIKARIINNIKSASKLLGNCQALGFTYPDALIQEELKNLMSVLDGELDINTNQMGSREVASFPEKVGYIFKNSQVSYGYSPNVLSCKFIKKLMVDKDKSKGPVRSWVWEWMEPDVADTSFCICDYCGERIYKGKTSNRKIVSHLAQHQIDLTTVNRFSKSRMNQYQDTMKQILTTHDKTYLDHNDDITRRYVSISSQLRFARPSHEEPYNSYDGTFRDGQRDETLVPESEAGVVGQIPSPDVVESLDKDITRHERDKYLKEISTKRSRACDLSESMIPTHLEQLTGSTGSDDMAAVLHRADELEAEAPNTHSEQFIRRYESFSPNTTMDTEVEGDISRTFHQFAAQTQGSRVRSGNELPLDDILSKAYLNSFTDQVDDLTTSENSYVEGMKNKNFSVHEMKQEDADHGLVRSQEEVKNYEGFHENDDGIVSNIKEENYEESNEDNDEELFDDAQDRFDDQPYDQSEYQDAHYDSEHLEEKGRNGRRRETRGSGLEMDFDFDFE